MLDFNCYIGAWPFHPTAVETLDQLQKLHQENGISGGFVSSFKSVFYRDYFESEEELHRQLQGTGYRQVMTVNPKFPACLDVVRHGIEHWNIAGVRIVPCYHGYDFTEPTLEPLCELLKETGLPLFLTMSLEDKRSCYLLQAQSLNLEQMKAWLESHRDLTVLLCGASVGEMDALKQAVLAHPAAFFEPSGMRHTCDPFAFLGEEVCARLVYGSMSGLLCLKSSHLLFEKSELDPQRLHRSGEGTDFLAKCPALCK